jgi:cell division protein FtsB
MRRLLPIFATGFLLASLLIWAFGDSGLRATARLDRYRASLEANVESQRARNQALEADLKRLREDPEANVLLARELGLYRPNDEVIRIEGLTRRREAYAVGTLLRQRRSSATQNPWFKMTGIGMSVTLVVFAVLRRRRGAQGRPDGRRRR